MSIFPKFISMMFAFHLNCKCRSDPVAPLSNSVVTGVVCKFCEVTLSVVVDVQGRLRCVAVYLFFLLTLVSLFHGVISGLSLWEPDICIVIFWFHKCLFSRMVVFPLNDDKIYLHISVGSPNLGLLE